ncbi:MAG: hypothetical protein RR712_03205 [Terrisporobacter sp.]|uniref:hypothetical protein n=1 Tax=Terrisporobacter sp. TaxID=1965305 RepID=UPI002FC6D404
MKNKRDYNKSLNLNHKPDYHLMNNYGDIEMGSDAYSSDLSDMSENIDFEKDEYFDNLQNNNNKFYF